MSSSLPSRWCDILNEQLAESTISKPIVVYWKGGEWVLKHCPEDLEIRQIYFQLLEKMGAVLYK